MRQTKRQAIAAEILADLRKKNLSVECGECGASARANWVACEVRNVKSWIACSKVECGCGCTLYSYIGDAVPMILLREHLDLDGEVIKFKDDGPVMSFVRRQVGAVSPVG